MIYPHQRDIQRHNSDRIRPESIFMVGCEYLFAVPTDAITMNHGCSEIDDDVKDILQEDEQFSSEQGRTDWNSEADLERQWDCSVKNKENMHHIKCLSGGAEWTDEAIPETSAFVD